MKILFLDTETGGLDETIYSLLTIGLVVWDDKNNIDMKEIWISKEQYITDPKSMAINKINLNLLQEKGVSELDAIKCVENFCTKHFGNEKIILAGHNISFDVSFLKKLYRTYGYDFETRFSHKMIDTVSILKYLYLSGQITEELQSFDAMREYLGITMQDDKRHTALGDALATAQVFSKLLVLKK